MEKLSKATGFQWDNGNIEKNWIKHDVTPLECEQIFFNQPLIIADDVQHSKKENRSYALGITDAKRFLFVVFTFRNNLIRIISARDMSKKQRRVFESYEKT